MNILRQLFIIFAVYVVSLCIEAILPFSFPASVIGIMLLFALLCFKVLPASSIKDVGNFLLEHITLMLIPVNIQVMNYFTLILENLVPFLIIGVVSTIVTYAAVVGTVRLTQRLIKQGGESK